jgi:molybdopterin synthase sulfur carrier subunit
VAIVFVPAPLRRLTGGRDRLEVAGETVGALVDAIDAQYPGFRARVAADGELLPSLAVSVDGDLVTRGLDEPVGPESEVHFVPALGGGQDRCAGWTPPVDRICLTQPRAKRGRQWPSRCAPTITAAPATVAISRRRERLVSCAAGSRLLAPR